MGEILQDSETYILQCWDEYHNRWNESRFHSYADAVQMKEHLMADDMRLGIKHQCRIIRSSEECRLL